MNVKKLSILLLFGIFIMYGYTILGYLNFKLDYKNDPGDGAYSDTFLVLSYIFASTFLLVFL